MKNIQIILLSVLVSLTQLATSQESHSCSVKSQFKNLYETQNQKSGLKASIDYDVHYYKLDISLENNSTYISGVGTISATVVNVLSSFEFELHSNLIIDSIMIKGAKQIYTRASGLVSVSLTSTLSAGTAISLDIFYHGTPPTGGGAAIGNGMSTNTSGAWGNSVTWSLSEPYSAYEWFPVKQSLSDKADSSEVWVTTSNSNMVGSNGVLERVTSLPNNKDRYEWKSVYPISYYLISVSVAQYIDYTIYAKPKGLNDSIKVVNYIYDNPGTLPNFKIEIDKTVDMLEIFSEKFGLYPFYEEKYGHCMAPFGGGMEHQTMTTQGFFFTDLTSHELGHQWFGDNVTCASWKDIWVNEGFASYSEYVFIESAEPTRKASWLTDTENSALNSPTGSVYVDDTTNVGRIFNSSLTYNKGAFLLHMLRFEINDDSVFFEGMRAYTNQYAGSNAKGVDFQAVMENTSGINFTDFFDQWYFGEGYPTFNIKWNQDALGNLDMIVDEVTSAPTITPFFKTHLDISITRTAALDTTVRVYMDYNSKEFIIPKVGGSISNLTIDPFNWVLNLPGIVIKDPDLDLGITAQKTESSFNIFPNPATDVITISVPSNVENGHVLIYDVQGTLVFENNHLNGHVFKFDLHQLAKGSYILEFRDAKESHKRSFILAD